MDTDSIRAILEKLQQGSLEIEEAMASLEGRSFADLGFAKVDLHRRQRQGAAEVVYCPGKTDEQIAAILQRLNDAGQNLLATRASRESFEVASAAVDGLEYHEEARIISKTNNPPEMKKGIIQVVTAGTSDIPVAEEAAVTAEFLGNEVSRTYDSGVAGVHRLFDNLEEIRQARVLVVVAGMEGALASVVGGLVAAPVIAVPTSIGYGANFGGLSALLGMLNSCASNVAVVNIDNGFGAGNLANLINGG